MKKGTKKIIGHFLLLLGISGIGILLLTSFSYHEYKKSVNAFVYGITKEIQEKYPEVSEQEIVHLLNQENREEYSDEFRKYGILEQTAVLYSMEKQQKEILCYSLLYIGVVFLLFLGYFFFFFRKREKKVQEIFYYLKEINQRNYFLGIENNQEDELSLLRNEVYKITIMLREESEQLKKEKILLKDSISDISHQLKTPLTSILILLDNILENPTMDEKTRKEFIIKARHQVENIHFLLVSLLKLSRFEADVVEFKKETIDVATLFREAIKNLEVLCEVKNVSIKLGHFRNVCLVGDFHWELEAITNILKNAIEHSKEESTIEILAFETQFYTKIVIQDSGCGMNQKDLQNIFTRFYKGENSNRDSIGIGLNLAKMIIEKDNGFIDVHSTENIGTVFEIKYMK